MKAVCPTSPDHNEFITVAHIAQDWVVDRDGDFIEQYGTESETIAHPCVGNTWQCKICWEEAIVTD